MSRSYRDYNPDQLLLLPPSVRDWLGDGHLALFLSDVVDELDLSAIFASYEQGVGRGKPPYHPRMMTKLLMYGYCTGVFSSRAIEQMTWDSVPFRVLAVEYHPDHSCIAEFRRRHLQALSQIFIQVLEMAQKMGLVKLGHIAIDGTKVKANASKHKAMSYGRMDETQERLKREIAELMKAAEEVDGAEDAKYGKDRSGNELPPEVRRREDRLKKIAEAKAELEREAKEQAAAAVDEAKAKQEAREAKEAETGKKTGGRPPAARPDPEQVKPDAKAQRNFTDPDSRIMVDGASKGFEQCYNAQAAADAQCQIIVAAAVTQQGNDKLQLAPITEQAIENTGRTPEAVTADAGYYSQQAVAAVEALGATPYVPPERQKHGTSQAKDVGDATPAASAPASKSPADAMRERLASDAGRAIYRMRKAVIEPVFGQIKQALGFRRFSLRGYEKVQAEWLLVCASHNLLKMFRSGRALPALMAS